MYIVVGVQMFCIDKNILEWNEKEGNNWEKSKQIRAFIIVIVVTVSLTQMKIGWNENPLHSFP